MPGRHVTDHQMRLVMRHRETDTMTVGAAKASLSKATTHRIAKRAWPALRRHGAPRSPAARPARRGVPDAVVLPMLQAAPGCARSRSSFEALDAADPPAPLDAAAQQIGQLIGRPTQPGAPKLREKVCRMIERIPVGQHESGAIEVAVRGHFVGRDAGRGLGGASRAQNDESP